MRIEISKEELEVIIRERFSSIIDDAQIEFEIYNGYDTVRSSEVEIKAVITKRTYYS